MMEYARIMSFEQIDREREALGKIVAASGGFDPLHPGHTSYLVEAKKLGDTLVAIVNGDAFLTRKKGRPFMDLRTRCHLVSCVRGVDIVLPFEIEGDQTVSLALSRLRPAVFAKGGDRIDERTIPEWGICQELGIEIITGVGLKKDWSSSDLLADWTEFAFTRGRYGETRPWGRFSVISEEPGFKVKRIEVAPGGRLSLQWHEYRSEKWVLVKGGLIATVGSGRRALEIGETVFIPAGTIHRLENMGTASAVLIEVATGSYLGEDDIVRIEDEYGRATGA